MRHNLACRLTVNSPVTYLGPCIAGVSWLDALLLPLSQGITRHRILPQRILLQEGILLVARCKAVLSCAALGFQAKAVVQGFG